ncbi:MAG TPA: PadR family transcriptional regulator [Vicinamibacterales bacterium]|jgi:DNA-binding PadR family transcriptional regulator|nr:PadR family transcriptional regulator [Vicinamibacterales bacterium]
MGKSPSYNALLILGSLADADRHGYAIRKDVAERSGGEVQLGSTTLYRMLGQLLDEGLIEEARVRPAPQLDDERRKYFHITPAGRRALAAELRLLERVLLAARPALAPRSR